MSSRSASRTFWMTLCFATWAAIRPKASRRSLLSSSSPICASGSRVSRAVARSTSVSGSVTASTTVLISNNSISPISGLNLASMRFWPKVRRAAESIALSSASMITLRSMPFSLLTCSITRLRSGCMLVPLVQRCAPFFLPPGTGKGCSAVALTTSSHEIHTSPTSPSPSLIPISPTSSCVPTNTRRPCCALRV